MQVRVSRRLRRYIRYPIDRIRRPLRRFGNRNRVFRPCFVAGAMGSGTSLVAVALGNRFECAGVAYESTREVAANSFLHVRALSDYASVAEYTADLREDPSWSVDAGRHALLKSYRETADGRGEWIVDKGPNANLFRVEFLARCFPEAPFLLVFRDPVVNIEGFRRKWPTFGNDSLAASIRFYREIYEHFLDVASGFGDRMIAIDYDTLVNDFEPTLDRVGDRLGLQPTTQSRRLASRANKPGKGLRNVRGNQIHIVRDSSEAAYPRLEAGVAEQIRAELGPLHERLRACANR